jgi:NADPH:quinone reductase-like Zn-dependent oxidoreductase
MKAIAQDVYGAPEVLELRDVPDPVVGEDDVLVRVHAAGVDPGVWHLMTGMPYVVRMSGYGVRAPKTTVLGSDLAGTVEAVGARVKDLRVGDEVFGMANGTFAELARSNQRRLALKPANVSFEEAAAVPTSASAALQALCDKGEVRAGQHVLVIGGAGGVGSFAVQLARAFGAEVTGVCSTPKIDLVRSIGATHVVDYTKTDIARTGRQYDLVIDTAGNRSLSDLRHTLTRRGTLVIVGGEPGGRWLGGTDRQLRALILSWFVRQRLRPMIATERLEDLHILQGLLRSRAVVPLIGRTYALSEAPDAIRDLASGHSSGKAVITI